MQHTVRTHNLQMFRKELSELSLQRQQLMLLVAVPTHPLFAAPTLRPQLRGLLLTRRLAAFPPLFLVALKALVHVPQLAAPQPCLRVRRLQRRRPPPQLHRQWTARTRRS